MAGLYGRFMIGVLMQKPNDLNPHLKFQVRFSKGASKEAPPREKVYTIADVNNLAWSRIDGILPCGYNFPPIDTECEIKCKHGWEPCVIHSHNKLIVEIAGDLLIVDPEYARFRTRHPVFGVLKKFGVEVTDEPSTALNDVLN